MDRSDWTSFGSSTMSFVLAIACAAGILTGPVNAESPASCDKKLIEYGWDVPTPAQMRADLEKMEKRPFDGIIFRLAAGHNAFLTNRLDAAVFSEDASNLRQLQFTRFKDNFVLVWGSPPAGFDWFDDEQWNNIESAA